MLNAISCLVVVVVLFALLLHVVRKAYRFYYILKHLNHIPTPGPYSKKSFYWLLGDLLRILKYDGSMLFKNVEDMNKPENRDVSVTKLWFGPVTPMLFLRHPKLVSHTRREPRSEHFAHLLAPWLGEGLLCSKGEKWKKHRRLLTPAFHGKMLKGYVPVYNDCLSVLLKKWAHFTSKGEPVKLFESFSAMSLDIIMQCALSFKSDCRTAEERHPYVLACSEMVKQMSDRILNPLYGIDWVYWLTPHGRKTRQLCSSIHQHAERIIETRTHQQQPREKCQDLLDILLAYRDEEGKGMSGQEVRDEVNTFVFAGYDTTTSAMSWTLYCLAGHPEHQDKVREEVRSVLMGREWLEYEDLKDLKYTTWCIKEALRMYPPILKVPKDATSDIELGTNCVVPKGIKFAIEIAEIHRNANIWERPNEYDPLRFQPANMERHGPYDYIPFSAGSRNCIGQNFAMNEMKVVVGTIVNRFSLTVDKTHKVEMMPIVLLKAKDDIKLLLKPMPL